MTPTTPRLKAPVTSEAYAMPPHHGVGSNEASAPCQPLPRVGIGTPNIRVDRFLRFAVRFRLVFFAFAFWPSSLSPFGHVIAPDVIQPSPEYNQQTKGVTYDFDVETVRPPGQCQSTVLQVWKAVPYK